MFMLNCLSETSLTISASVITVDPMRNGDYVMMIRYFSCSIVQMYLTVPAISAVLYMVWLTCSSLIIFALI